jgi:hypothetical protein
MPRPPPDPPLPSPDLHHLQCASRSASLRQWRWPWWQQWQWQFVYLQRQPGKGQPFLALILQPLDWHHQHVAKPVHGCSFVPSIATLACLRHYTTPQPSDIADGGLLVILDSMVYEVGPTVPR